MRQMVFPLLLRSDRIQSYLDAVMKILFCTYVDEFGDISGLEVVKNRGLVEIRQVRHVLATLKLRRVDLGKQNKHVLISVLVHF